MAARLLTFTVAICSLDSARSLLVSRPPTTLTRPAWIIGEERACPRLDNVADCSSTGVDSSSEGCIEKNHLQQDLAELGLEPSSGICAVDSGRRLSEFPPRRKRPMMWIHIHKSGGTLMCAMAQAAGENVVKPSGNCNWRKARDGTTSASRNKRKKVTDTTCAERSTYFNRNGYTWGQIEHEMSSVNYCLDDFDYGVMLRDPLELAQSETNYAEYNRSEMEDSLKCIGNGNCRDLQGEQRDKMALWMFFDNYMIRILGGDGIYSLPPGGVTEQHAAIVMERLSNFKTVFTMEDMGAKHTKLFSSLGWVAENQVEEQQLQYFVRRKVRSAKVHLDRPTIAFDEAETRLIREQTKHDYTVYQHFRMIITEA